MAPCWVTARTSEPDYTAEALHWMTDAMRADRSADAVRPTSRPARKAAIDAEIAAGTEDEPL